MEIKYTGRNIQIDDDLKSLAESKLTKLDKFIEDPAEIHLTLETEKHRQIAEIHVSHRHGTLKATEEALQMTEAIQKAVEKAEKQARRSHKKAHDRKRRAKGLSPEDWNWPLEVLDSASFHTGEAPRVVKSSNLPIKPMTIDEAALNLTDSKNGFFVFRDATTDKVSVLYKRTDGHYGLIAPEF